MGVVETIALTMGVAWASGLNLLTCSPNFGPG